MNEARTKLTPAGTHEVQIFEPRGEALEPKDGDNNRMMAILPGETGTGEYIEARLMFTRTIIQSGKNKGKPTWQISAEKLHELGIPKPFNPNDLIKLDGVVCLFVTEQEEYDGKTRLEVKFINTQRREALAPDAAQNIWNRLTGGQTSAPAAAPMRTVQTAPSKQAPAPETATDDDVPW